MIRRVRRAKFALLSALLIGITATGVHAQTPIDTAIRSIEFIKKAKKIYDLTDKATRSLTWVAENQQAIRTKNPDLIIGTPPRIEKEGILQLNREVDAMNNGGVFFSLTPPQPDSEIGVDITATQSFVSKVDGQLYARSMATDLRYQIRTTVPELREMSTIRREVSNELIDLVRNDTAVAAFYARYMVFEHYDLILGTIPAINRLANDLGKIDTVIGEEVATYDTALRRTVNDALRGSDNARANMTIYIALLEDAQSEERDALDALARELTEVADEIEALEARIARLDEQIAQDQDRALDTRNRIATRQSDARSAQSSIDRANERLSKIRDTRCDGKQKHPVLSSFSGVYVCERQMAEDLQKEADTLYRRISRKTSQRKVALSDVTRLQTELNGLLSGLQELAADRVLVADRMGPLVLNLPGLRHDFDEALSNFFEDDRIDEARLKRDDIDAAANLLHGVLYDL